MIKQILEKIPRKASDSNESETLADNGPRNPPRQAIVSVEAGPALVSYEPLPRFREVPSSEKLNLFINKLNLCQVVFDFSGPPPTPVVIGLRDIKRQTLLELVDHISSIPRFDEALMLAITKMAAANLFRTFPPPESRGPLEELDDDDDDDNDNLWVEPAWSHIQIVYELLLRFVASPQTDPKLAKRFIDRSFVLRLIELFESEDPRERDYLKTILHRVYSKFTVHRPFIRKAINNVFYRFVLETQRRNGIGDLLELYGSIIEGFAFPLKEEHKLFLSRALLPLHKPKCLALYQKQLTYCVVRFLEKDSTLAETVIRGLLKYWPLTNSSKEVVFLGELEEVLEATQGPEFKRCLVPLFRRIARCLNSFHFQVAERTLLIWNTDHIRNLITENCGVILPIILPALENNIVSHWNQSIQSLSLNVRKIFEEADQELFEESLEKFKEAEIQENETKEKRELKWKRLEEEVGFSEAISSFVSSVAVSNFWSNFKIIKLLLIMWIKYSSLLFSILKFFPPFSCRGLHYKGFSFIGDKNCSWFSFEFCIRKIEIPTCNFKTQLLV